LVVCTANICRSPMAAALLAAAFVDATPPVEVSSAGFLFADRPASDTATKVLRERQLDLHAHRSRIVERELLDDADLVLTMERRHARDLILEFDNAEKIHTLKGFAQLVFELTADDHQPPVRGARALLDAASAARSNVALLGDGRVDEIADPHGRSARVHRKTVAEIAAAVDVIAAAFATAEERAHA
jgi:protein-tyrosine phosphatase